MSTYATILVLQDLFSYTDLFLHYWDKSYLLMVFHPFSMLQIEFISILLRSFSCIFIKGIGYYDFPVVSLSDLSIREMLVSSNVIGKVPSCSVLEEYKK